MVYTQSVLSSSLFLSGSRLLTPNIFTLEPRFCLLQEPNLNTVSVSVAGGCVASWFFDVTAPKDFYKWLAWSRTMQLKDKTFISNFVIHFSHFQNQRSGNFFLADLRIENVLQPKPS